MNRIAKTCDTLGFPLKAEKVESLTTTITFLGIVLDSVKMETRLPEDKALDPATALEQWEEYWFCRKRVLLLLIGKLSHACKVIRVGRLFLGRMINLATRIKYIDHWIHLNAEFRADIGWWRAFLQVWDKRCMMLVVDKEASPDFTLYSDASGNWGRGAISIWVDQWLQWQWEGTTVEQQIAIKKLIPIVIACMVWDQ